MDCKKIVNSVFNCQRESFDNFLQILDFVSLKKNIRVLR